jgi:trigger factor
MATELIHDSQTRKTLKIEIEADVVRKAYDKVVKQYAQYATVPGFRPGHAPIDVVKMRFKDEIKNEVLREVVPNRITNAIRENDLDVIGEPEIHVENSENIKLNGSEPILLHVHVEALPEITLDQYKGLEATRRTRPMTDDDINYMLDGLREHYATLEPIEDRPSEIGDIVTVDFHGRFVDEPEAEEIDVEDVDVELGGPNVEKAFTENLTGVQADEEKTFIVDYPADFTAPGLAGKKIEYAAKVIAVRRMTLPELDDEWAKSLDEGTETIEKLLERIRENITTQFKLEADAKLRIELMDKLINAHDFEVPQTLVQYQTYKLSESFVKDLHSRGIDAREQPQEFWQKLLPDLEQQAIRDLRGSMILEAIAEAENIDVTSEDIEEEFNAIAMATHLSVEQVRATLTKENGERSIADRLRNRKALDFVVENAKITEAEWREEDQANETAELKSEEAQGTQETTSEKAEAADPTSAES